MGSYDTVHAGDRHGQTKALGKSLSHISLGEAAVVIAAPMTEAEFDAWLAGEVVVVARSAQVQMYDGGGFLHIRDGVLTAWDDVRDESLPLYDGMGQPLQAPSTSEVYEAESVENCAYCEAVRAR